MFKGKAELYIGSQKITLTEVKSPSAPIVIGVLGKNPFGGALADAVAGKTLG